MYVVIEKHTGKIVWTGVIGPGAATVAARKFANDNPGTTYYAAYLYLEVVTGMTEEKTEWQTEK